MSAVGKYSKLVYVKSLEESINTLEGYKMKETSVKMHKSEPLHKEDIYVTNE